MSVFPNNFQKTWHIGNVKTWHTTWQLNGLKWAKLGAEAYEWLTPAMLYALTGEYIFGEAGTLGPCAESYVEKCPF